LRLLFGSRFLFFGDFFFHCLSRLLFLFLQLRADELEDREFRAIADAPADSNDTRVATWPIRKARRQIGKELFCGAGGGQEGSGLTARVIMRSASGRAALARRIVVWMRSFSMRLVTRFRNTARRCAGCFPSLCPETRCLMIYSAA